MRDDIRYIVFIGMAVSCLSASRNFTISGKNLHERKSSFKTHLAIQEKELVDRFYLLNNQQLFWFGNRAESFELRQTLKGRLDSSIFMGFDHASFHHALISGYTTYLFSSADSLAAMEADRILTEAAIIYCQYIHQGNDIDSLLKSDQVSPKYFKRDESYILDGLIHVKSAEDLNILIQSLQPKERDYWLLMEAMKKCLDSANPIGIKAVSSSLSQYRWIRHFNFDKYIVVNIPTATVCYYESDSLKVKMKAVLGKPSTRTPRFAAFCNQIIVFPYWNVPHKIAVSELLPMFKRSPASVSSFNMQIIDARGRIIPNDKINWSLYSKDYFPFRVRQLTGCDNALGLIKFNLTDPFDVYMHDTNLRSAFKKDYRYRSHGCIRLERPFELANDLLNTSLDSLSLADDSLTEQTPTAMPLDKPVPVLVVYMTANTEGNKVFYSRDIYHLLE